MRSEGGGERPGGLWNESSFKQTPVRAGLRVACALSDPVRPEQCAVGWMRWPLRIPYIYGGIFNCGFICRPVIPCMIGDFESV